MNILSNQQVTTVNHLWQQVANTASYDDIDMQLDSNSSCSPSCEDEHYSYDHNCDVESNSIVAENQLLYLVQSSEEDDVVVVEFQSASLDSKESHLAEPQVATNNFVQETYKNNMESIEKIITVESTVLKANTSGSTEASLSSPIFSAITPTKKDFYNNPDLIGSWADIKSSDDEEDEKDDISSEELSRNNISKNIKLKDSFKTTWNAWYDPPLGKIARNGISKESYEKHLVYMGLITNLELLWTMQDTIDWKNLPANSTVSFSLPGTKPYWEHPTHAQGGRWIIKGFERSQSETLFMKTVLSLFLNHLPDYHEFTCLSLQVKSPKRGNSLLFWCREVNYAFAPEILELLQYFLDNDLPKNNQTSQRRKKRRNKKLNQVNRNNLSIHFCPNLDSIERNAVKLVGNYSNEPRKKKTFLTTEGIALRCDQVTELYSQERKKRRKIKCASKYQCSNMSGKNSTDINHSKDSWRYNTHKNEKRVFVSHSDIDLNLNDEDLIFVDFQPELIGWTSCGQYDARGCWYPVMTPVASSKSNTSCQPWNTPQKHRQYSHSNSKNDKETQVETTDKKFSFDFPLQINEVQQNNQVIKNLTLIN